jgi:hypothetical protein
MKKFLMQVFPKELTVCRRVEKQHEIFEGSTKGNCVSCKKEVWISPGTRLSVEMGLYPDNYACEECVTKEKVKTKKIFMSAEVLIG